MSFSQRNYRNNSKALQGAIAIVAYSANHSLKQSLLPQTKPTAPITAHCPLFQR